MRINKIRIKNINSLRGNWEVDFTKEPFLSATLFSITGATGAGKSTLLDAITLALYNQIPRIDKVLSASIIENGKFILTRNESECFSEVEYSCKKGLFRARWSIGLKKRGGFRDYEMEITDLLSNEILDVKRKDIPKTNAELIGLNYDQFIRSILLSQGGFSRFLDAGSDERAKLLEQITGTGIYRQLGIKAGKIWKSKNNSVVLKSSLIDEKKKRLIGDEEIELKKAELKNLTNELFDLNQEKTKLSNLEIIKSRINKYHHQINQNNEKLNILLNDEAQFNDQYKQILQKHRRLLPYISRIQKFTERNSRKNEISNLLLELESNLKKAEENKQNLKDKIENFIGKKFQEEETEKELLAFRNEIVDKEKIRKDAGDDVLYRKERISDLLNKAPLNQFGFDSESENLLEEIKKQVSALSLRLSEFEANGIKKENAENTKSNALERNDALNQLKGKVEQYTSVKGEIEQIKKSIDKNRSELVSEEIINQKKATYDSLLKEEQSQSELVFKINRENSENILKLRESLVENEPCIVCGSVHHPYAHAYSENISKEVSVLEEIKQSVRRVYDELEDLKKKNAIKAALIEENSRKLEIKEDDLARIKNNVEDLKLKAGLIEVKTIKTIDEAIEKEKLIVSKVEQFEEVLVLSAAMTDLIGELTILNEKKVALNLAEEAVLSKYTGINILEDTDNFSREISDSKRAVEDYLNQKETFRLELENILVENAAVNDEIFPELQSFGYDQTGDALPDILDQVLYDQLNKREQEIYSNIKNLRGLNEQANTMLEEEKKKDDPEIDEVFCNARLLVLGNEIQQVEEAKNSLAVLIKSNAEEKESITVLEKEIEEETALNKKWFYLDKLIGEKSGKTFNLFVQYFTLSKLIKLANLHMKKLNDRYLLELPLNAEQNDLLIIDRWMGDETRSAKSSSGGEKFLISLALALALSDLASREVKIESLFIDEGFAALDSEALDQAVSTLEQLQSSTGKSVGIISHVEELKARIQTQIKVEKSGVGFSTIRIMPELE